MQCTLLCGAKAPVVATKALASASQAVLRYRTAIATFFWEESFKQLGLSFFVYGNSSIPAIIINSFYFTAVFNLNLLSCILFAVFLSLLFHRVKK